MLRAPLMMVMIIMVMMKKYPYIVLKVIVAARVLPECEESLTVSAVGRTLLGQEEGGVPQLILEYIMENQFSSIDLFNITKTAHQLFILGKL